jgi:hypothetical protein
MRVPREGSNLQLAVNALSRWDWKERENLLPQNPHFLPSNCCKGAARKNRIPPSFLLFWQDPGECIENNLITPLKIIHLVKLKICS